MGLFGTLSGVSIGMPVTLWSPAYFVRHPDRWLAAVARDGHTVSPLPNFGTTSWSTRSRRTRWRRSTCSRWRVAFNGAETVSVESVEAFLRALRPGRLPARRPCSRCTGMAEATLAVTFPPLGRRAAADWVDRAAARRRPGARSRSAAGAPAHAAWSALGRAVPGMAVRVADPETGAAAPDREVGEVQVRGASVTVGLPRPGGADLFTADGWLRTGDLGYLARGELYLTGRIKDMMIVRGANYYPRGRGERGPRRDGRLQATLCRLRGRRGRRAGADRAVSPRPRWTTPANGTGWPADLRGRIGAATGLAEVDVHLVAAALDPPHQQREAAPAGDPRADRRRSLTTSTPPRRAHRCTAATSSATTSATTGGCPMWTSTPSDRDLVRPEYVTMARAR